MPGNDAVLFFSETHVVEVKEIIMSGVFLAGAVGSRAGAFPLPVSYQKSGFSGNPHGGRVDTLGPPEEQRGASLAFQLCY